MRTNENQNTTQCFEYKALRKLNENQNNTTQNTKLNNMLMISTRAAPSRMGAKEVWRMRPVYPEAISISLKYGFVRFFPLCFCFCIRCLTLFIKNLECALIFTGFCWTVIFLWFSLVFIETPTFLIDSHLFSLQMYGFTLISAVSCWKSMMGNGLILRLTFPLLLSNLEKHRQIVALLFHTGKGEVCLRSPTPSIAWRIGGYL